MIFHNSSKRGVALVASVALVILTSVYLAYSSKADTVIQSLLTKNAAPTFEDVIVSTSDGGAQVSEAILTEGENTELHVNGTVSDLNGCHDIKKITAVLYRSDLGADCTEDLANCYVTSTTAFIGCSGSSDTSALYHMVFDVASYADATDAGSLHEADNWVVKVTATDQSDLVTSAFSPGFEIDSIAALNVTPSLNFGTLHMGEVSEPRMIYLANKGNRQVIPYFAADGDFACDGGASMSISASMLHMHTENQISQVAGQTGVQAIKNLGSVTRGLTNQTGDLEIRGNDVTTVNETVSSIFTPVVNKDIWDLGLAMDSSAARTYEQTIDTAANVGSALTPIYFTLKIPESGVLGDCATVLRVMAVPQ